MAVSTVAILSPGDMGSHVARALIAHGIGVITCLEGRSGRTAGLARGAGIGEVAGLDDIVREADLVLSLTVPGAAAALAASVARAIANAKADTPYADCNAISPASTRAIGETITAAGGRFIDAGIIGGPPKGGKPPRFYASGPHAAILGELDGKGIAVPVMGGAVGDASAIKMLYSSVTKGTQALNAAALIAAETMGLSEPFRREIEASRPAVASEMEQIANISARAFRFVAEMEEVAATFQSIGVQSSFHTGAAEVYADIAASPIGDERPETVDRTRSLADTVRILAGGPRAPAR